MYAVVMELSFEAGLAHEAASAFSSRLLPQVTSADGFRGGYWLEPRDGKGLGLILFDEEAQARSAGAPQHWQAPGVEITQIDVRRVAASA